MSDFDVIVKTFQRPWLLGLTLQSIRRHWGERARVIVADDGTRPDLWALAQVRYGLLADNWIHSEAGEAKWSLCRQGRFADVVPTCGVTWNRAAEACRHDVTFLIEDDSRVSRDYDPATAINYLHEHPEALCVIGMRVRCAMEAGGQYEMRRGEGHYLRTHPNWPWSFDGVFYRRADWQQIGPWPQDKNTGSQEGFVQQRLAALGWRERSYAATENPCCDVDSQTSVRTDRANYEGRFRHVDAVNNAWLAGEFVPTYDDVAAGRAPWIRPGAQFEAGLHYPRHLRQINYVTGHELCGELHGAEADARWLSQANAEAARYGEAPWGAVPDACRS